MIDSPEAIEARRKAREVTKKKNREKFAALKTVPAREPLSTKVGQLEKMKELRGKFLTDGNASTVMRKILEVAYNDQHPGQMQALKMCFDRMLPQSMFEEKKANMERPNISITISGINDVEVGATLDGEFTDSED